MLLFLTDETLNSEWCLHEVQEARRYGIPIICVGTRNTYEPATTEIVRASVDVDNQTKQEVIDHYMARGLTWLFDDQVISYR